MADSVSSSYSYLQTSSNRISGLSSGMDIDSLVEKLMKAESAKMEKLQQQKQKNEWQRDAYREIDLKLETFHKESFDQFGLQKSMITKKSSVSDTSKVDVKADPTATGTLNISAVSSLATSGSKMSNSLKTTAINAQHKLSDFGITDGTNGEGSFEIIVDSQSKIVNFSKDETIESFLSKLSAEGVKNPKITSDGKLSVDEPTTITLDNNGKALFGKLGFEVDADNKLTKNFTQTSINTNSETKLKDIVGMSDVTGDVTGHVTLNVLQNNGSMKETSIEYSGTDTIDTLVKSLNSSGAGVTAVFNNGQMSLTSNATGKSAGGSIQVIQSSDTSKTDGAELFKVLGFTSGPTGSVANGTNATYTVNGIQKESTSNEIKESGYTITLKQEFSSGTVNITSTTDTDAMFEKVESFIKMYNDLVDSLNTPMKEKRNYNYSPLTEAQKAEMSDDEIEKWEEKAKQGLLRNDTVLSKVLSSMRESIYHVNKDTTSPYNALFNIGVTTTETYTDGGKIEIKDEQALRDAIAADPEAVAKIFTDSENGIIAKLRKAADYGSKQIDEKAGKSSFAEDTYTLGKSLISINEQIENWKDRLKTIEERYYKQFAAMEDAINKANSQSSLFMQ